jgi:hypothetical protein
MKNLIYITIFLLAGVQLELYSQEKEFVLKWKDVSGNKGYIVRISTNQTQKEISAISNITTLKLNPGKYAIQVAAKNRFGKPGKFSELKEIDISNDTQKEIDLSQEKPQVDFNKGTKVDTRNYQTWIPGSFQYKHSNWADASLYWITIPSLAYIGYTEKIRGDQIAKDPWNDPVNLFFLLQNRSPLEIYYFRNRREEQKSKYADAQVNQKYIASGLLLFYAFHWVDLYFFDGEGIIKSFSSSHREQANLGIDHITGVEFQWRFDTSQ